MPVSIWLGSTLSARSPTGMFGFRPRTPALICSSPTPETGRRCLSKSSFPKTSTLDTSHPFSRAVCLPLGGGVTTCARYRSRQPTSGYSFFHHLWRERLASSFFHRPNSYAVSELFTVHRSSALIDRKSTRLNSSH